MKPSARPNILLLMTDQHAPRIAGFAGDPCAQTRHLDALAARSVQFDAAVCASPVCTSSRMCLLTAKEAHRCAAWNNHWIIFPEHVTWPSHFAAHGYRTCLVGKMHFGGRDQMQGFQVRPYGDLRHGLGHQPDPIRLFPGYAHVESAGITEIPESLLQDVVVTRETAAFLLEHQDTEPAVPWFVCASYSRPHSPLTAPGRYVRRYRNKLPPLPFPPDQEERLEPFARRFFQPHSPEQIRLAREAYYACVNFVDDCVGELLEALAPAGLLENTVVIYTSDHGEMAGVHGLWDKCVYYDPSICVPLLMGGPGIRPGRHRVVQPISLMDLFPTACGLAGLPIPEGLDGVDHSRFLADPDSAVAPRQFAPSAYYRYGVKVQHLKPVGEDEPCAAMRVIRRPRLRRGGEFVRRPLALHPARSDWRHYSPTIWITAQVHGSEVQRFNGWKNMKIARFEDIEAWQLARELTMRGLLVFGTSVLMADPLLKMEPSQDGSETRIQIFPARSSTTSLLEALDAQSGRCVKTLHAGTFSKGQAVSIGIKSGLKPGRYRIRYREGVRLEMAGDLKLPGKEKWVNPVDVSATSKAIYVLDSGLLEKGAAPAEENKPVQEAVTMGQTWLYKFKFDGTPDRIFGDQGRLTLRERPGAGHAFTVDEGGQIYFPCNHMVEVWAGTGDAPVYRIGGIGPATTQEHYSPRGKNTQEVGTVALGYDDRIYLGIVAHYTVRVYNRTKNAFEGFLYSLSDQNGIKPLDCRGWHEK